MPRIDKPIPSLPSYHTRPVFVKNTYANISSRPSKFIKPAAQHQNIAGKSPTDLDNIAKLFLRYNHKMYIEGYLTTMAEVTPEGGHLESRQWKRVFAELSGSTLAIWDAEKSSRQEGILPSYVNITDSTLEILDQSIVGKSHCFAIQNTAGANRFLFQARTRQDMEKWESCFWLACFEGTKLHEMYTRKILARSLYKAIFTKQPSSGVECYLQVRFAGKSDWKRLWTVVDKKDDKKRWGRKASSPLPGQILLYEDKKSRTPMLSMTNIVRAYAIYPETPQLSEHSTLFKVEGSISTVSTDATPDIPDRISHVLFMANNSKEMAQWLMSTFDIFKLYGRPQQMSFNQVQADGIHYSAESLLMIPGKLFLDIQEVQDKGLCDKKRWDQKGVFTDELQRKLDFEEHEPKKPAFPKRYHAKSKSLQPSHIAHLKSKSSTTASFFSERASSNQPPQVSSVKQQVVPIPTKQIGDSSEDDTEDDIVGETDEDTDDGSNLRIQSKEGIVSRPRTSPTQLHLEPRQLTRQGSTSSSFLLDFGNLSGSRNMSSRASSATASTSSLFGDFARSTELSKYIDPSVFEEDVGEDVDDRALEESHDGVPASANSRESRGNPLSFPKSNIRGLFPKLPWGTSGAIDYDKGDDHGSLSDPSKYIEDLGGREGPPIPSLGDQFASENSLLAKKPADLPMTAQEQTEYARAMRQPFLHVPVKPRDPSSGLIGRITQLEYVRQQNSGKGAVDKVDKVHAFSAEVEKERYFERERDRQLTEHRQQQMLQHVRTYPPKC
jgi:PH domain